MANRALVADDLSRSLEKLVLRFVNVYCRCWWCMYYAGRDRDTLVEYAAYRSISLSGFCVHLPKFFSKLD